MREYDDDLPESDFCSICGSELELVEYETSFGVIPQTIRYLLVDGHLPYCPICGILPLAIDCSIEEEYWPEEIEIYD